MSNQSYDWSMPDAQILEYLQETVRKFTGVGLTFSLIQKNFGMEGYRLVVATFQAAMQQDKTLEPSYLAISTARDGLLIDDDERLSVIDGLAQAGGWPDTLRDGIKAIAVVNGPRWQIELGLTEAPTLESIAAARAAHEDQVHNQLARVAGVRFGEQFRRGDDAGAVMSQIWSAISGN